MPIRLHVLTCRRAAMCLGLLVTTCMMSALAASADAIAPVVAVGGLLGHPMTLNAAALAKMPHVTVQATMHGTSGSWSGVPLSAILAAGGAPVGEALHGKNMALYVRIGAADGYSVVYALAELDPQFRNESVILADQHDGKPLEAKEGPFRVVAPTDLRPARWIREVVSIDLLRAPDGK
jgi:DMSO/TMAO reductase YedYZ molybdopterin-dependent catalytic subunit